MTITLLGKVVIGFPFASKITELGYTTKASPLFAPIALLIHSGAFLAIAALAGYAYYNAQGLIGQGG